MSFGLLVVNFSFFHFFSTSLQGSVHCGRVRENCKSLTNHTIEGSVVVVIYIVFV